MPGNTRGVWPISIILEGGCGLTSLRGSVTPVKPNIYDPDGVEISSPSCQLALQHHEKLDTRRSPDLPSLPISNHTRRIPPLCA
jgi:hypothetical protein